jgi:hypothetical protein
MDCNQPGARTHTHTRAYIQDVFKMLRYASGVNSSHPDKDTSSYKHLSGNEWLWSSVAKLRPTISTVNLYHFTYKWQSIYSTSSQFSNSSVLTAHQATVHSSCSTYPPPDAMHARTVWSHTVAHFQRSPEEVSNGLTGIRKVLLNCLHILNWNALGFWCVRTQQNVKDWGFTPRTKCLWT